MPDARDVIQSAVARQHRKWFGRNSNHTSIPDYTDAILRALEAAGYTPPLPKEATEEMALRGHAEHCFFLGCEECEGPDACYRKGFVTEKWRTEAIQEWRYIWRAMVAAAGSGE